jgi:hypothetical protein
VSFEQNIELSSKLIRRTVAYNEQLNIITPILIALIYFAIYEEHLYMNDDGLWQRL